MGGRIDGCRMVAGWRSGIAALGCEVDDLAALAWMIGEAMLAEVFENTVMV